LDNPEDQVTIAKLAEILNINWAEWMDLIIPWVVMPWLAGIWFGTLAYDGQIAWIMTVTQKDPLAL
jgi:hypothetical protein